MKAKKRFFEHPAQPCAGVGADARHEFDGVGNVAGLSDLHGNGFLHY